MIHDPVVSAILRAAWREHLAEWFPGRHRIADDRRMGQYAARGRLASGYAQGLCQGAIRGGNSPIRARISFKPFKIKDFEWTGKGA